MLMQKLNTGIAGQFSKAILLCVLLAAFAGLILTDVGGFFRGGVSRADVARVGNKKINIAEFIPTYRRALQQSGFDDDRARQTGLAYIVLQQELAREIMLQTAQKMGIRIDDSYIAQQLMQQLNELKIPGTNKEKLDIVLQRNGVTEREFVNLMKGDYALELVTSSLAAKGLTVPSGMMASLARSQNEKRIIDTIRITSASVAPVGDKELETYFAENREKYRTAEKRTLSFLVLPKSLYAPEIAVDDSTIEAYFNEHKKEFMSPERVHMEQVIVQDEKTAQKLANEKPASFADIKDGGIQPIPLDWYSRAGMPKELADAVFSDKTTGIHGPVKTSLGWHVLRVDAFENGAPRELSDVRNVISRQLRDEKLDEVMNGFSNQIDSMISGGSSLDDIADEYKLETKPVADITPDTIAAKIKEAALSEIPSERINDIAFTLSEGEISPLIDTPAGDYVLVQVTAIVPAAIPALAGIRDRVQKDAMHAAQGKAVTDAAEELIGTYDGKNPAAFYKAVQAKGLPLSTSSAMTKREMVEKMGEKAANLAFTLTPGNDLSFISDDNSATLIRLKTILRDDKALDTAVSKSLEENLRKAMTQELQQQFMAASQSALGVTINQELMRQQFVDPKSEN